MKNIANNYDNLLSEVTKLRYDGKQEAALNLIKKKLSDESLKNEEKIPYVILKASILENMGVYKGLTLMLNELIEEISSFNLPEEYLEANLLKITTLLKLSLREEGLKLIGKMEKFLTIHKEISLEKRNRIKGALLYQKGTLFWHTGKPDIALEYLNHSLAIVKDTSDQELLGMVYNRIGTVHDYTGRFEESLWNLKKNFEIQYRLMNKRELSTAYNNISDTYLQRGEYDIALEGFKNSFALDEEIGNKSDQGISLLNIGITHLYLGNQKIALKTLKDALFLNEEAQNDYPISSSLHFLIRLFLETQAPKKDVYYYLEKLEKLHQTSNSNIVQDRFFVSKGLVLKSSNRLSEKVEAQTYFKKVVNEDSSRFDMASEAVLNLIDLLLLELKSTESTEVLGEIEDLTSKLLEEAKRQNIAPTLIKTFILKSKLKLLQLEIDEAKELLDKAGELADENNFRKLSLAVIKEQKELYNKLNSWENLAEKKVSLRERVELAQIEDTVLNMISHKLELVDDIENLAKEFEINKLGLLVVRFGSDGAEFFKGIDLPKSEDLDRDLYFMSVAFATVLGQGDNYHTGLFGPLPVPMKGYSAIIYSLMMNDRDQTDKRLKGKTYTLFCILYPQHFSSMFYKRTAIINIFEVKIAELEDLMDLTESFLTELQEQVYQKITEIFAPTSFLDIREEVSSNIKPL